MADLPENRVSSNNSAAYVTGVDYFGPFEIKQFHSLVKRYGWLFTCLSINAVHIEIAPSLMADAFINFLRRFVSRRGHLHTRGDGEDTTFDAKAKAKDTEKVRGQGQGLSCRGQVASRPRTKRLVAKDSRIRLKIRANINVNTAIIISQTFKRKIA